MNTLANTPPERKAALPAQRYRSIVEPRAFSRPAADHCAIADKGDLARIPTTTDTGSAVTH
jgi:hypothetical protein